MATKKNTKELQLISETELDQEWYFYPIERFIRKNEDQSGLEVDIDATFDLADNYFLYVNSFP